VKPVTPTCFVVCAIGGESSPERLHADWVLEEIIEPVMHAAERQLAVLRADRMSLPGLIDAQIIGQLLSADLVIAALTFLNPNAFYEIGIRHVVQKPIIHIHREGQEIPFDISLFRSLAFSLVRPKDIRAARDGLRKLVSAALAPDHKVENPVTKARGSIAFNETATPVERVLRAEMAALAERVHSLEGRRPKNNYLHMPLQEPKRNILSFFREDGGPALHEFFVKVLEAHLGEGVRVVGETKNSINVEYPVGAFTSEAFDKLIKDAAAHGIEVITL